MLRCPRTSSARIAIRTRAVLDASVVLRAVVAGSPVARDWLARLDVDVQAHAPELMPLEVASGLRKAVRANIVAAEAARRFIASALRLPIELRSHRDLAASAFEVALTRGLTLYDAAYVVLAEALDGTLVTADRTLAGAARRAELIM
jgi:predicted nucleic acid-binding protein